MMRTLIHSTTPFALTVIMMVVMTAPQGDLIQVMMGQMMMVMEYVIHTLFPVEQYIL